MAGGTFHLFQVGGYPVLDNFQTHLVAVKAGFGRPGSRDQARHGVAGAALDSRLGVDVGCQLQVGFAVGHFSALIAQAVFARGHAVVIGPDKIPFVAGETAAIPRLRDLVAAPSVAVGAACQVTGAAPVLEKPRVVGSDAPLHEKLFTPSGPHRTVEQPGIAPVAADAAGCPVGRRGRVTQRSDLAMVAGKAGHAGMDPLEGYPVAYFAVFGRIASCRIKEQQADGDAEHHQAHDN